MPGRPNKTLQNLGLLSGGPSTVIVYKVYLKHIWVTDITDITDLMFKLIEFKLILLKES